MVCAEMICIGVATREKQSITKDLYGGEDIDPNYLI